MKNFKKNFNNNMKNENGAVIVFVALMMVVLLAFASLGIDMGLAYYNREKLQTACDAAALAGAQYLPNTVQAKKYAEQYFNANYSNHNAVNLNIGFTVTEGKSRISVSADTDVNSAFGGVVGIKKINVATNAAASVQVVSSPSAPAGKAEFPYLLYAQTSSSPLALGGNYFEIDGAVHSNGAVNDYPNTGTVRQISSGTNFSLQGNAYVRVGNVDFVPKKAESWGLAGINGSITVDQLKNEIDKYYLIPAEVFDAYGNKQWYIQSIDWLNNTELYTSKTKENRAVALPLSSYIDTVFKKETFNSDSDAPIKMIKEYVNGAEARITALKNKVNAKFDVITDASVKKDNNNAYFASSHNDEDTIVVKNSGQYYVGSLPSTVTQKNITIAYKGNDYQFINAQPSSFTTYKCNTLIFYSDSNSSNDNGIAVRNMKITTGNIYSNSKMKIRNEGGKAPDFVINGDIYADGDLYLYHVTVNGDIYCTGNINAEGCAINGFMGADKNISYKGERPDIISNSASNPMALSVFSRNGNVEFIAGDAAIPQYVAGVVLATKGKIQINSRMKFYGNFIANKIENNSAELYAYPLSALEGFESDNILTVTGDGAGGGGAGAAAEEKKVFLVE